MRLAGRTEEAVASFDRAIEIRPDYAQAIGRRGFAYGALGRQHEALADFDRAFELEPGYIWALAERGRTQRFLGAYQDAIADLDRAIEADPNWEGPSPSVARPIAGRVCPQKLLATSVARSNSSPTMTGR